VLPDKPQAAEPIARFLRHSNLCARTKGRVKPAAFLPAQDGKVSVFRTGELKESAIWSLGRLHLKDPGLSARAELQVQQILDNNLLIEADNDPVRHANIVGWPKEKDARKSITQQLAAVAILHILV